MWTSQICNCSYNKLACEFAPWSSSGITTWRSVLRRRITSMRRNHLALSPRVTWPNLSGNNPTLKYDSCSPSRHRHRFELLHAKGTTFNYFWSGQTGASELPNHLDAGHLRPQAKLYAPVIAWAISNFALMLSAPPVATVDDPA